MRIGHAVLILAGLAACWPAASRAQSSGDKPLIGVLDLQVVGGTKEQAFALSNQLRTEILKTGRFTVVDRSRIEAILEEQALQQTGCTTQACAVRVGRILGIRQMVTGSVTRIEAELWQVSTLLIDVETAETLRSETLNHEGPYADLLFRGMARMAALLAQGPPAPGATTVAPPVAMQAEREPSDPHTWWRIKWIGALGLALAAAYFGLDEAQATAESNDLQKSLMTGMAAATSQAQYDALGAELRSAEGAAEFHKQNSDLGYAAAALFVGLAAWIYLDPPAPAAAQAQWLPQMVADPHGLRLTVQVHW